MEKSSGLALECLAQWVLRAFCALRERPEAVNIQYQLKVMCP